MFEVRDRAGKIYLKSENLAEMKFWADKSAEDFGEHFDIFEIKQV